MIYEKSENFDKCLWIIFFFFAEDAYNLLAIPFECNFSGTRFNLNHVRAIKEDFGRKLEGHICQRLMSHI